MNPNTTTGPLATWTAPYPPSTPRVNKALMAQYRGKFVRLVAYVTAVNNNGSVTVRTTDKGVVNVTKDDPKLAMPQRQAYFEFIGVVLDDDNLRVVWINPMGDTMSEELYESTLQIWHAPHFAHVF